MNRRMFLKIAGAVAFGLLHPVQAVRAALRRPEQKAGVVFPEDGILRSIIVGPWKMAGGYATVTLSDSKHDPGAITLFNIVAIPHDELWSASCFCYIRVHSGQRLNVTDEHGAPMPFTAWLLAATCQRSLNGDYVSRELTDGQTLENLYAFGDRLEAAYKRINGG